MAPPVMRLSAATLCVAALLCQGCAGLQTAPVFAPQCRRSRSPMPMARCCSPRAQLLTDANVEFDQLSVADHGPVGVLLLSVGAPETPDDVEEYLYNVFCDPEIRTLPPALAWALNKPLAWLIAKTRAEEARQSMISAGGRSPQLSTIQAQAAALREELADRGVDCRPFIAMRYWKPFAEDAVEAMKAEGIQKLVILPLYPQFSLSTSGSALRVLERMLYTDPSFPMKSSVVPAWYNRPGFLSATANRIEESIQQLPSDKRSAAHVLYTAQGLPAKYVEELGDPYQEQVERSVALVNAELQSRGLGQSSSLAYQGAFGPQQVRWLEPSTSSEIRDLASSGVTSIVLVPISFVFEHMATLNEMDREYASLAASEGIDTFIRVPTLGIDPTFVDALANVVMEALPDLSRPSMQQINTGSPVSLNMVNEYTRLYTKDQLQLVPQERPWGFTEQAELINGRIAMAAVTLSVALTVDPTLKMLVSMYRDVRDMT